MTLFGIVATISIVFDIVFDGLWGKDIIRGYSISTKLSFACFLVTTCLKVAAVLFTVQILAEDNDDDDDNESYAAPRRNREGNNDATSPPRRVVFRRYSVDDDDEGGDDSHSEMLDGGSRCEDDYGYGDPRPGRESTKTEFSPGMSGLISPPRPPPPRLINVRR